MRNYFKYILFLTFVWSCTPKTEAINYGEDQCAFCKMAIVEDQYASETVTSKGKVYKYDDISCMIRHIRTMEKNDFAFQVVNDFDNPKEFLDVEKAFFIQSDQYASPMGGNTAAFRTLEQGAGMPVYTWAELEEIFN